MTRYSMPTALPVQPTGSMQSTGTIATLQLDDVPFCYSDSIGHHSSRSADSEEQRKPSAHVQTRSTSTRAYQCSGKRKHFLVASKDGTGAYYFRGQSEIVHDGSLMG